MDAPGEVAEDVAGTVRTAVWDGGVRLELESRCQYITASFPLWDPMNRSSCHGDHRIK